MYDGFKAEEDHKRIVEIVHELSGVAAEQGRTPYACRLGGAAHVRAVVDLGRSQCKASDVDDDNRVDDLDVALVIRDPFEPTMAYK